MLRRQIELFCILLSIFIRESGGQTPAVCNGTCLYDVPNKIIEDEDETVLDRIKEKMKAENIDANLR